MDIWIWCYHPKTDSIRSLMHSDEDRARFGATINPTYIYFFAELTTENV